VQFSWALAMKQIAVSPVLSEYFYIIDRAWHREKTAADREAAGL